MRAMMYCCVILHNMVVKSKRPLVPLDASARNEINVGDQVEHSFVRESAENSRPLPGSIAAMCATKSYLNSVTEYMTTRRLIFDRICTELNRK